MKTRTLIIILIAIFLPASLSAQALPFTAVDYNPISLAKGGTSIVQTSSVSGAAFTNAASVPFSDLKADLAAGYAMWAPDGVSTNVLSFAGAFNIKQELGIALGVSYGMNPAYDVIDASGASKGQFKPTEMQLKAGVSYRFLPFLSLGANIGYASSKLAAGASYGSLDADVFLMAKFGGFKLAAGLSDLGTGITSASGTKYSLPTAVSVGLGYDLSFGEKNAIEVIADGDYYLSGGLAVSLGACYAYDDLIFVRAGYRAGGQTVLPSFMSLGLGVKFAGVRLDLAYLTASPLSNTIALGLGYSF